MARFQISLLKAVGLGRDFQGRLHVVVAAISRTFASSRIKLDPGTSAVIHSHARGASRGQAPRFQTAHFEQLLCGVDVEKQEEGKGQNARENGVQVHVIDLEIVGVPPETRGLDQ